MQKEVPTHSWRQSTRPGKHEAHTGNESHARHDDDDDDDGGGGDDDDVERFESVWCGGEDAANDVHDAEEIVWEM